MTAVLYAIPASHPCAVVERALQLKRVAYRRVELIPVLHRPCSGCGSTRSRCRGSSSPTASGSAARGGSCVRWRRGCRSRRSSPPTTMRYSEGAKPPVPRWFGRVNAPVVSWMACRIHGAGDLAVRADLVSLPGHLDRVDGWIARGVLGGEAVNAADLQIAARLRLLLTVGDVAPLIDAPPAGALARRVFAAYPGGVDAGVLPSGWVPGGRRTQ